jgi:hypothetical protein
MRAFTLILVLAASVIAAPLPTESETVHADGWGGYVNSHYWCIATADTLLEVLLPFTSELKLPAR